jgi:hypothetical protein
VEGPSLVIATEEFKPFIGSRSSTDRVKGEEFLRARSWGKHFILEFADVSSRHDQFLFVCDQRDRLRRLRLDGRHHVTEMVDTESRSRRTRSR